MVTIIFIADDGDPVHVSFSKTDDLNTTHEYGKWYTNTNRVELNDRGWQIFQLYRKEIRKLKPLLQLLEKCGDE